MIKPDGSIVSLNGPIELIRWTRDQFNQTIADSPRSDLDTTDQSAQAIIAELRTALASREATIKDLRQKGGRAIADRDRWEAAAKNLQSEIAGLKTGAAPASGVRGNDADKFRELKVALAKMFHPDAHRSASNFERVVREELFKEINVVIDRI